MLKDVKICDPAIGSGAFPMGLLKELFLCRSALEGFDPKKSAEIKKHIIQQNIYGVDIEKGAVDIARLRFWLSLIVDEESPEALPNLDFKIMQGNSLLEQYKGIDLSNVTEKKVDASGMISIFDDMLDVYRKELREKLEQYYNCANHTQKIMLRSEIAEIVKKQIHEQGCDVDFGDIDLSGNDQFFLWHTWFHEVFSRGGFDIVIGNPPYIDAKEQLNNSQLQKQREYLSKNRNFKTLYQKWDLYIAFMEVSIRYLCKFNGVFTMIVPFPLTNQLYAKKMREMIVSEFSMFEIVDLNGTKIFENATVSNCIPFIYTSPSKQLKTTISNINSEGVIYHLLEQDYSNLVQDKKTVVWNLMDKVNKGNRHEEMHVLGDFCYISVGMVLNADEKKAKGEFVKADLISEVQDEIHCKKYIEGKDIERYRIKRIRYLEYGTKRSPGELRRPTFEELYISSKLLINALGNLKASIDLDNNYYCEQQVRMALLWKDLSSVSNKSITSSIQKFSILNRREMELLSESVDLRYLLGIINSKYASLLLTNIRGGDYHIVPEHIRNIPIPSATQEQQKPIVDLVVKILKVKEENPFEETTAMESEIDNLVYHLYGLTYDEVLIVDPETPITREEYDNHKMNVK